MGPSPTRSARRGEKFFPARILGSQDALAVHGHALPTRHPRRPRRRPGQDGLDGCLDRLLLVGSASGIPMPEGPAPSGDLALALQQALAAAAGREREPA